MRDEVMWSLSAGCLNGSETPLVAAKKELLEETGYSGEFEYIGELYEYPTKLNHRTHVVRARNIKKQSDSKYESTEWIEEVGFIPVDEIREMIKTQEIKTAVIISALYMSVFE
jgi:ADP-ribose pyrophosphatase